MAMRVYRNMIIFSNVASCKLSDKLASIANSDGAATLYAPRSTARRPAPAGLLMILDSQRFYYVLIPNNTEIYEPSEPRLFVLMHSLACAGMTYLLLL